MPRQQSTAAARKIVGAAATEPTMSLVAELAEPLAEYMLDDYEREDWQDSPLIESLAHSRSTTLTITESRDTLRSVTAVRRLTGRSSLRKPGHSRSRAGIGCILRIICTVRLSGRGNVNSIGVVRVTLSPSTRRQEARVDHFPGLSLFRPL